MNLFVSYFYIGRQNRATVNGYGHRVIEGVSMPCGAGDVESLVAALDTSVAKSEGLDAASVTPISFIELAPAETVEP